MPDSKMPHEFVEPTPGVAGVAPYSVPKHPAPIDLKLDANEGEAPSQELLERLISIGPDIIRRYPDASVLQNILAERHGVASSQIIVTAGADDALDRLCRSILMSGRNLVETDPGFEMLPRYARLAGAEVREVLWPSGPFPTDEVITNIDSNTALVAFVSPNNPTGTVGTLEDLQRLSAAVGPGVVLADFAYIDFADDDITAEAIKLPNVVVTRTLSKAWGLAGLRVGYAIGPAKVIGWMRAAGGPYAVSRPSIAMATIQVTEGVAKMQRFVDAVKYERTRLRQVLAQFGVTSTESQANYVLMMHENPMWIRDALAGLGIAIRAYPGHPRLSNALRVSLPGHDRDYARLEAALVTALKPEAILFDYEGALTEPTPVRHTAVLLALRDYNVSCRIDDVLITLVNTRGDHFEAARRILAAHKRYVPDQELRDRLDKAIAEQRANEKRTVQLSTRVATELSLNYTLAVFGVENVEKAKSVIDAAKLKGCFELINGGITETLQTVRCGRAWALCGSIESVISARQSGVVPIAVLGPGERRETQEPLLLGAGAARVIASLEEIIPLLGKTD